MITEPLGSAQNYDFYSWGDLFNSRQKLALICFAEKVRQAHNDCLSVSEASKYGQGIDARSTKQKRKKLAKSKAKEAKEEEVVEEKEENFIRVPLDKDDYISMDLDKCGHAGLRLTFIRTEGRKKRTVALQFDNDN